MVDFIVGLIALGEITTGLLYCFSGVVFLQMAVMAEGPDRTYFRLATSLLFLVGGLEELADSVVQEGSGNLALWVQGVLTFFQVLSGSLCAWALIRAGMHR